ncbi:MAG: response regulator, partial [Chloroflexi bacterium]|nr:response regulator [Chloroflexota bacterium]
MPHTIVYIEDETAIIELIGDVLSHPKVKLVGVPNPAEGIKAVKKEKPDLILLDVMMPGTSGWDIYHALRADEAFKRTPIIMLTGQLHRYRVMKEFSHSPVDAYITKPFNASDVRTEIEKMLSLPLWSRPSEAQASAETPKP